MKNLLLFEKYIAPFDDDFKKAEKRVNALKMDHDFLDHAIWALHGWFYGRFMMKKDSEDIKEVTDIFKRIGEVYHNPIKEKMYRVTHMHIEPGTPVKDIRKVDKVRTGPKQLQSWSTSKEGAEWFFNHFVRDQNKDDTPHEAKTWVLLSTDAEHLGQLLTFEECMQFLYDVGLMFRDIEEIADHLVGDDMLKLHELICDTPPEVPIRIENILVPPLKKKSIK